MAVTGPAGRPPRPHDPLPDPWPAFRVVALQRLAQGGRGRTEAMRAYGAPMLIWFTRGQGRITVAGVTAGFGPHNAVFLPAGTMHGFEAASAVYGTAVFFPRGTSLVLPDAPVHLRFRDVADQTELTQLIDNIQRELDRALPLGQRALQHHAGLLSVWLERQMMAQDGPDARESAARRLSAAYAALVETQFRSGRGVADFAADLGVTPAHLTRCCTAACGRSADEVVAERIFLEARRLLRDSETPVKQVAAQLGFPSAAFFARAFWKATGETPTGFRRTA